MARRPASGLNFTTPRDCFVQFIDLARSGPGYFCVIEAGRQVMIGTIGVWLPRKIVDGGKKHVGGLVISRGALSGLPLRAQRKGDPLAATRC